MAAKAGSEQRRFPRVPFKKSVKFGSRQAAAFAGNLAQDLSQGGIRIHAYDFIPVGSSVMIQLKLADEGRVFDVPGRVMWVKYQPQTDAYQMGLEFDDDTVFAQRNIAYYVLNVK